MVDQHLELQRMVEIMWWILFEEMVRELIEAEERKMQYQEAARLKDRNLA